MSNDKKGIFTKIREMAHLKVDAQIEEARSTISETEFKKSLYSDKDMRLPYNMRMRTSLDFDPQQEFSNYGYKPKFTLLTDTQKLQVYLKDAIIAAIVQTRTQQVAEFSRPQKDKYSAGFIWERKDKEPLSDDDKENIDKLNEFILKCGFDDEERDEAEENMDFETFLKLILKDRLIYDSVAVELIRDHNDDIHHFLPVSSPTIRFTAPNLRKNNFNSKWIDFEPESEDKVKEYKFVQIINEQIQCGFTADDLVYKFGNPSSEIFTQGYSIGELDLLITIVTAHINSDTYNRSIFSRGFLSQGIINLKGEMEEEQIQALRRSWYNQGVGPTGMNRTPIINSPDGMEFIKLENSHHDMQYANYADYLIKIIASVYQIAPEEINFSSSNKGGVSGGDQNYNNVEKRLKISKDRGLRPLLRFIENIINEDVICQLSEDVRDIYQFRFVGLDVESKQDEIARQEREVKFKKTLNEIRAEDGLDPIEGGELILDPNYFQWYSQFSKEGKEAQEAMMGMGGMEEEGMEEDMEEQLPWEEDEEMPEEENLLPFEEGAEEKLPFEKSRRRKSKVVKDPELIKVEIYKKK